MENIGFPSSAEKVESSKRSPEVHNSLLSALLCYKSQDDKGGKWYLERAIYTAQRNGEYISQNELATIMDGKVVAVEPQITEESHLDESTDQVEESHLDESPDQVQSQIQRLLDQIFEPINRQLQKIIAEVRASFSAHPATIG